MTAKNEPPETSAWTVAVVDDDDLFRESLEQNLLHSGFGVSTFADGETALSALLNGQNVDLVLLDWKMPNLNGIEVLKRLRAASLDVPVIFLTVLSDQIYEEAALTGGAVDFVEKSRSYSILLNRIRLILEGLKSPVRPLEKAASTLRLGDLELDSVSNRARWKQQQLELTLTEFKIVAHLAQNAGCDIGYRDIYDTVHGVGFVAGDGDEGFRANVRTFVKRIRQKFRAVDPEFDAIENYAGFGYRWRGPDGA